MARSHGVVKNEVWEPTNDFRRRSPLAQWAYMMLISQPQINNCGVVPYVPEKWVRYARGLTDDALEAAIRELEHSTFVVVDEAAGELLIRTFVKHDRVWRQPNLIKSARRQWREIESDRIREVLLHLHPWLEDERRPEDVIEYEENRPRDVMPEPLFPASPEGVPEGLSEGVPVEGVSEGVPEGVNARTRERTRGRPQPLPPPQPLPAADQEHHPRTEASYAAPENPNGSTPAAADEPDEPLRTSEIRHVLEQLPGYDPGTTKRLEPLLAQLPRPVFTDLLQRVQQRRADNPIGLLRRLAEEHLHELQRQTVTSSVSTADAAPPPSQRARTDPAAYLTTVVPEHAHTTDDAFNTWLDTFLDTFADPPQRDALRAHALAVRADEFAGEPVTVPDSVTEEKPD